MSEEMGLKFMGKGPDNKAKAVKVNDDGTLPIVQKNTNMELASGEVKSGETLEIPTTGDSKSILISLKPVTEDYAGECNLHFQAHSHGEWLDWHDGVGAVVTLPIVKAGVFGPYQGFPFFGNSRLKVTETNVAKDQTYTASENPQRAHRAFNEVHTPSLGADNWNSLNPPSYPVYLQAELNAEKRVQKVMMWGRDGSSTIRDFEVLASNNESEWTKLHDATLQRNGEKQYFEFENDNSYKFYRISIQSTHGGTPITAHDIRMYEVFKFKVAVQGVL